jgi:transcriptional regulator with XRE-family HTH domain
MISRIENNQRHPEYATLERICGALSLTPAEHAYVFRLAGCLSSPELPDRSAVAAMLAKLAPHLEMMPYPAGLVARASVDRAGRAGLVARVRSDLSLPRTGR